MTIAMRNHGTMIEIRITAPIILENVEMNIRKESTKKKVRI